MTVKVRLLTALDAVDHAAAGALSDHRQVHLFDRLGWLRAVWPQSDDGRPLIAMAEEDGVSAWLYLGQQGVGTLGPLGRWYLLAFRPIFSEPLPLVRQQALLAAIAEHLRTTHWAVNMAPIPEIDGSLSLLAAAFQSAGWQVVQRPTTGHWFHQPAPSGFEAYWAGRPSQLRNMCARKSRQLPVVITIHSQLAPGLWDAFQAIYSASWKPPEGCPETLARLAHYASTTGALRLGIAQRQGRPVAAQFWTVDHQRAIIHKLAYCPHAAAASPGTQLSAAMFRSVIDTDQVRHISYGTGDDPYKSDWMEAREQLWHLACLNPDHASGRRALLGQRWRHGIKKWLRVKENQG